MLLITMIGCSVSVGVIEDGTPEEEDLAKALAQSKRFFWRNMVARWRCSRKIINIKVTEEHSLEKLQEICESWKLKALAADAYAKSLECNQTTNNGSETSEENSFKCLCVKPRFHVAPQGELQLSSAMEAIKVVYRDLFKWGTSGEGLKIEINFENQEAWDLVDRWKRSYENEKESEQKEEAAKILRQASDALKGDAYFDQSISIQFQNAPARSESALDAVLSALAAINELTHTETKENGEKRNYMNEFVTVIKELKERLRDIDKNKLENEKKALADLKMAFDTYEKLWDIVQELGLDMATICEAGNVFKANFVKETTESNSVVLLENVEDKLKAMFSDESQKYGIEETVGLVLWVYKHAIHDPMLAKHPLELKKVQDPCEEAKLKVKKTEGSSSSG
ncbi:hypothetical protein GPALN_010808 [Globodera pallida]|nr:hypothetical protein GPALN_010808 [Globodera pallida]